MWALASDSLANYGLDLIISAQELQHEFASRCIGGHGTVP